MPRAYTVSLIAAAGTAVLLGTACAGGTGPPELVLDRSACDRCGMLISEPRFAAAYRVGRQAAVFDDIGCLLDALDEVGSNDDPEVWFLDSRERWLTPSETVFVRSAALETPMGGGIVAVADRAEASALATRAGGRVIDSLAELRASRRPRSADGAAP